MASPTSWLGTSAWPWPRTASSTCWASCARASASTGRPWQARVTPAITLLRLNGSVTPLRLTTDSSDSSTVVNRREHSGQDRRRRIAWPSSTSRESMTLESGIPAERTPHAPIPPSVSRADAASGREPGPSDDRPVWIHLWTAVGNASLLWTTREIGWHNLLISYTV